MKFIKIFHKESSILNKYKLKQSIFPYLIILKYLLRYSVKIVMHLDKISDMLGFGKKYLDKIIDIILSHLI